MVFVKNPSNLVYNGTPACTGLYMLIAQAVEAESIWQGCSMPPNLAETLMKELHLL